VVAILIGEPGTDTLFDIDERLGSVKRATGLDSRYLFYLAPELSVEAVTEFVKNILVSLHPFCVEYYRDLSKHTRRKRNRNSVPPPTAPPTHGTSQTLPLQGWNVRYEFKLGVFAEFRQEMDAACRNYESAYDGLFSPDLFETISSWSPRFNEARLLADTIALRILRCLLWTAQPTAAARFWIKHRNRTNDLVNRRGKGTANYGWEAWEAVWSQSFAQMHARSRRLDISVSDSIHQVRQAFSPPGKSISIGERIAPWELLHHDGYWWNKAWKHTSRRRDLAYQMPEEDRTSPGQSPASAIANRSHFYDSYLALEPHLEFSVGNKKGYDYSLEIVKTIQSTTRSFLDCHQTRFVERLRLDEAREHLREQRWDDVMLIMRLIWPCLTWRQAGWWRMVAEAAWIFRQAAIQTGNAESLLRLDWEAHSSTIPMTRGRNYDLSRCLDGIDLVDMSPSVIMRSNDSLSPVWASLYFATPEGNVGEPLGAQLVLTSTAHRGSEPIRLSEVKFSFEGGLRPIRVLANDSETPEQATSVIITELQLRESSSSTADSTSSSSTTGLATLVGTADIVIQPGHRKVFDTTCIPREAGDVKVTSITLVCKTPAFSLTYVINQQISSDARWWFSQANRTYSRLVGREGDPTAVKILPKPPKIRIELPNVKQTYYTNEKISFAVVIRNEELEMADVSIEARLLSPLPHGGTIRWEDTAGPDHLSLEAKDQDVPPKELLSLPRRSVGSISSAGSHTLTFLLDQTIDAMQHELEINAHYHLINDPETFLSRSITVDLRVSRPFEANYEFLSRLDPTPWPSFFDPQTTSTGLAQRFLFVSKIASFVMEPVVIESVSLSTQNILGNAVCDVGNEKDFHLDPTSPLDADHEVNMPIAPEGLRESSFELVVRKNGLDDRHSVAIDLTLVVQWRRGPEEDLVMTTLDVPRYVIPMSEPRVLLCKRQEATKQPGLVQLQYTIENASMHYLTFNLTMESSDEFAFSGPKATSFSLVPVSRHTVDYRIIAHHSSRWVRVNLAIMDAYFSKALKIHPASQGIRSDGKRGLLVWVE
jgi:trafficking protein particle complex subunit 11